LAGATLTVSYEAHPLAWNRPRDVSAVSGADGEAVVRVADWWVHGGPTFTFAAPGYLELFALAAPRHRMPEDLPACSGGGAHCRLVQLFRAPPPRVCLVVPDGYVGPLAVALRAAPPDEPGTSQRDFEWPVSETGAVIVDGTSRLLVRHSPVDYHARMSGGAAIPRPRADQPDQPALRWVSSDYARHRHLFVVGTEADALRMKRRVHRAGHDGGTLGTHLIHDPERFAAVFEQLLSGAARVRVSDRTGTIPPRRSVSP
jgi:hypothetical protein